MEKTMKARVQHKHDIEANWLKATNFIPLASEIIVYDPDENYDYPRIKIGDGKTNINALPFVTKDYAKISDIPTKPADIGAQPAGNYLTSIPSEYVTENELNNKGYLTNYTETDPTVPAWAKATTKPSYTASEVGALPSTTVIPKALSDLTEDTAHRVVTDVEKEAWNAKSNFSGNYDDLTNKPTIPSITGLASTTYVDNAVKNKVDKDGNKVLSTNDYTTAEKNKLAGIAAGAEANINADWNATSGDAQILNKPTLGTMAAKNSVAKSDLVSEVQTSLGKADTALQPTDISDWAKADTKPNYTAGEVGADPSGTASSLISIHNSTTDAHKDIREELNDKLDFSNLSSAIEEALTQAKESGAFDGEKGEPGNSGVYIGSTKPVDPDVHVWINPDEEVDRYVKSVNGIIPDENGNVEIKIPNSSQNVDLTGYAKETWVQESFQPKGDYLTEHQSLDGYAKTEDIPTKPEDIGAQPAGNYLTEHQDISGKLDKNQGSANVGKILIVGSDGNLTLTDMPEGGLNGDVVGVLDDSNNILLSGELADGTYTLKWLNKDGTYSDAGTIEVSENVEPEVPPIVNLALPDETATGQSAWESGGWCNDSYMAGSSYAYRSATNGRVTTNTFAVDARATIYVKGINYAEDTQLQIALFNSENGYIKHGSAGTTMLSQHYIIDLTKISDDYWSFQNANAGGSDNNARFIRIAGKPSGNISDIIITCNQPIE